MSSKINVFDKENFIQEFIKKFENALMNMPFIPEKVTLLESTLTVETKDKSFDFTIDFSKTPKENIFHIRNYLYETIFPVVEFSHKREDSLSVKEIKELIDQGVSLEEALLKTKITEKIEAFKIKKVLLRKDELILKSLQDPEDERIYTLSMPVSILLKRIYDGKINSKQAGNLLIEKTLSIKKIYPEQEWNKILKEKDNN